MQQADDYENQEFESLENDQEQNKSIDKMKINIAEQEGGKQQSNAESKLIDQKLDNIKSQAKSKEIPVKVQSAVKQQKKGHTALKKEPGVEQVNNLIQQKSLNKQAKIEQQEAQNIKQQTKHTQHINQQQAYEQFKKQIGVTEPQKLNISQDQLDKSIDPIAEALKNQQEIKNQDEVVNANHSHKSNNSSNKEYSTRPPAHQNDNSKFTGASKTILKNLEDQDSIDQSMQHYQSQETINFHIEDGQLSSSKFDDSKSLAFLKNLPKKEQKSQISGDIGDYSDTFDLSASQSVFHQLRPSGMPIPNALRGQSSNQNSQFLSSNPHFMGKGGRGKGSGGGGGIGSRLDSTKFSNYLKTIDSQPPQVQEEDDIDQK